MKPATSAPKLDELGWLAGTWHSAMRDARWQSVAGALYGIALGDRGFEVDIIGDTDDDGKPAPITLLALANGRDPMRFALTASSPTRIALVDERHRSVVVTKTSDGWRGEFTDEPGRHPTVFVMHPAQLAAPPELAAADRAFEADTQQQGAASWPKWFAPDGAMWRGGRVEGAAIEAAIGKTLAEGSLHWQPVASGARGDLGFTLGTYTFGATEHGSYATIWRNQPGGGWKVVFDIGRPAR